MRNRRTLIQLKGYRYYSKKYIHMWRVSLRPPKPRPRSHWDRCIRFRVLIETHCINFCIVIETAESTTTASLRPRRPNFFRHSFVLKTTFLRKIILLEVLFKGFRGLIETDESASAVSLKPRKPTIFNEYLEFHGEFEPYQKRGVSLWIRALGWVDWWKKKCRKSRDTVLLNFSFSGIINVSRKTFNFVEDACHAWWRGSAESWARLRFPDPATSVIPRPAQGLAKRHKNMKHLAKTTPTIILRRHL
jgi:hypothetical protein